MSLFRHSDKITIWFWLCITLGTKTPPPFSFLFNVIMECKWRPNLINCLLNLNAFLATQVLPVTYSDSSEYVLKTNKNFDYVFYYANFCDGYSREQTYKKLKSDVENSIFNYSSTIHDPTNWLSEQLAYNLPVSILSWMFMCFIACKTNYNF